MSEPTVAALTMGRTACWTLIEVAQSVEKALAWVYEGEQIAKGQTGWAERYADQYAGLTRALLEVQDAEATVKALFDMPGMTKEAMLTAVDVNEKNVKDTNYWTEQYGHFCRAQRWAIVRH